ncbi:ASCH domain-containing protein [Henriciella aquimarina]|uniref:ASCH domain-containing protein n=1 Tax=Henriciella aquimarina TaxID=545261 RepID=UPI000A06D1CA|nr:ASCH domain-containing protein [Henriciella aquimarina]
MTPDQQAFWDRFQTETGDQRKPHDIFAFGDSPDMAAELLDLVLAGTKRATATRLKLFQLEQKRPPAAGDLSMILDGADRPACVIETTAVNIAPFNTATEEFAYIEGEGDRTLESWRQAHLAYFRRECAREGTVFAAIEPIVFEQFRLIWTPDMQ